jgi:hypothetical protein
MWNKELATYDMGLTLAVMLASEFSCASFVAVAVPQMRGDCL